jgi:methylenetetrahydrofolate dehydrogenase (NADP+)/methenyltetrahydrofolate cyclohydrolase
MGEKIDGKLLAQKHKEKIKEFTSKLKADEKRVPKMVSILVGDDGGSIYYMKNQIKVCNELGLDGKEVVLEKNISENELIGLIEQYNGDNTIDGIMLLLPLPKHLNEKNIISKINPDKDIDGLTEINIGKFYSGDEAFTPCTPRSVMELLKSTGIELCGKNAVVIGRSNIVGKPVFQLLLKENCTVTICHSKTNDLEGICSKADILVSAIGKPQFITAEYVKEGAIVIDVGTSSVNGKITGDVVFDDVINKASYVTPVPGGIGAVTTTMLIENICEAYVKNVH